jgi:dihydrofolate reductase
MARLRTNIATSLDGFVAGPNQSVEDPLGVGGMQLHNWAFELATWRAAHGLEGGVANASSQVVEETLDNIGASIMGRNMFGGSGRWKDQQWDGWWGDDPPFHTPVFVVTHTRRDPWERPGGTTFHFVNDGIESALDQAREAAGDRDVRISGGAETIQEYLDSGLIDEFSITLAPVLFGTGIRLFDRVDPDRLALNQARTAASTRVTHLTYTAVKR